MDLGSKVNILLVDDEPKNLFALRELLGSLKQNLISAPTGEEALRVALKNDLAVILLDVRMPGMDGFETARLLRSRERSRLTPIVFLTAAAEEMDSVFRGYEVGAVDYLIKPIVPEVLKSKVAILRTVCTVESISLPIESVFSMSSLSLRRLASQPTSILRPVSTWPSSS